MTVDRKASAKRREKERLDRQGAILRAARRVFFSKGLMAATVDEIAETCGIAKGTVYLYFQSKEDIYVSLMNEGAALLRKEMERAATPRAGSDALLKRLLKAYCGFYRKNREYFRIMFLSSHPDIQARISEGLVRDCIESGKASLLVVSDAIRAGVEGGLFSRDTDPWATANILWAMVNGIIMIYEQDERHREGLIGVELDDLLAKALDLVLRGLKRDARAGNRPA
jgi:AcrR family transcriptional regulator